MEKEGFPKKDIHFLERRQCDNPESSLGQE